MSKPTLFQYAVIWHPTERQRKEEDLKSKIIIDLKTVLATDTNALTIKVATELPSEYKDQLDQLQIAIRPF